ncbi:MAG: polymerase sigma-70 factor, expansion family 1 [Crocinitomicaceae bacterium]|nr:polymerase sigma-70 factor, expansion family 1 [Crocinitomicaceae bacterium]
MSNLIDIEYLFKEYYKRLFGVAYQVVNDETIADDIVQEVFIHIWNKRDELNITTTIEGYLVRSTVNRALNYIEKNKRVKLVDIQDHLEMNASHNQHRENNYDQDVFQKLVYASLDNLPPKCKTIFTLSRFESMKNKEIADHLGVSVKTVENQITIAISKLNQELKPKIQHLFPELLFLFLIFFQIL